VEESLTANRQGLSLDALVGVVCRRLQAAGQAAPEGDVRRAVVRIVNLGMEGGDFLFVGGCIRLAG
jgi:hypothetical protein